MKIQQASILSPQNNSASEDYFGINEMQHRRIQKNANRPAPSGDYSSK